MVVSIERVADALPCARAYVSGPNGFTVIAPEPARADASLLLPGAF
ncbi:MAG: hypothetical protein H8F28_23125 [Fibrella sp.]|nr:hypothetical protein [Armatimonadota bacterium]